MKTQLLTIFLLAAMTAPEVYAQTRGNRGGGNRGGGAVNRPTPGPARPTTRPTPATRPSRPTTAPSRPVTRPTPTPTRPVTRPVPTTRPVTRPAPRPTPVGPRVNPNRRRPVVVRPTPTRPVRRINPYRPDRRYYGTGRYFNPHGYRVRPYSPYRHVVVSHGYRHPRRYATPYNYFRYVRDYYRNYVYLNWIMYPSVRNNGYYQVDGYPYFVYNGYQNRYSEYDSCNYQLVDKFTHQVVRTYWNQTCFSGYNSCAMERDQMNSRMYEDRYMCAETFRDDRYDFGRATYDYEYEDDLYNDYDYNNGNGGYYDEYYDEYDNYNDQYYN